MQPLAALLLSDDRPGHYIRAEGILAAIARLRPVKPTRVVTLRRRLIPGRALATLLRAGIAPARVLRLGYGMAASSMPRADIVVSSGGNTLAANIAVAKHFGIPNSFYGGMRQFSPHDISLILTSYGPHAGRPHHRMIPLMPVPLDPDALPAHSTEKLGLHRAPRRAGLLIGGDAGTFRYSSQEWQRLLAFLVQMHELHGTTWMVANSRRTPRSVSDEIARLAREKSNAITVFVDARVPGAGPLGPLFAQSEAIICTEDSSSMITEAIWARRPVIGAAPAQARFAEREGWYRAHLARSNWTRSLRIFDLTPARVLALLSEITPLTANPLDQLAGTIKQALPALVSESAHA